MKTLQKDIKKLLEQGIAAKIFPSAAAGITYGLGNNRKSLICHCGNAVLYPEKRKLKKNNFFDLASLTKPLATTLAILCLVKEKKIDVDEKLSSLVEKRIRGKKSKITTRQLLSHSSGLPAHREYFNQVKDMEPEVYNRIIEKNILQEKLVYEPGTAPLYSDLGFMLLGRIIEKKAGCNLSNYVEEKVLRPLHLEKKIFFNPLFEKKRNVKKTDFAATEVCPWREKILCGEVHDDNCFSMGGVAGHSGLFGNIEGVTALAGKILDMWKGVVEHPNIKKEDLVRFLTRQTEIASSSWALGFDTPAKRESSSGNRFSQNSVGHLGFTGTSFWIDPNKDIVIVLLTNRVHPSRKNNGIRQFRPFFHNVVMEKLFKG